VRKECGLTPKAKEQATSLRGKKLQEKKIDHSLSQGRRLKSRDGMGKRLTCLLFISRRKW